MRANNTRRFYFVALLATLTFVIAGCSGGSGDDDDDVDCSDPANATDPACEIDCDDPENAMNPTCMIIDCEENPDHPDCEERVCLNPVDCDGDGLAGACDADDHDSENLGIKSTCDADGDGHIDVVCTGASVPLTAPSISCDNCIGTANPGQVDTDGDGFGDACDDFNCTDDRDGDLVCDVDIDGDGVVEDNCVCPDDEADCSSYFNPDQTADIDGDGIGDACDDPSVMKVAAGLFHNLALKSDGTVWAWGKNDRGQLGNGETDDSFSPVQVVLHEDEGGGPLSGVKDIAAGREHSCALKEDGTVWCWGRNNYKQVGDGGSGIDRHWPKEVNIEDVGTIALGSDHTLALKNDGTVWAWGRNHRGQLGNGLPDCPCPDIGNPVPVAGPDIIEISSIAAGNLHSVAMRGSDGKVFMWGGDRWGQLGDGNINNTTSRAIEVPGLDNVIAIASGGNHTIALKEEGEDTVVLAWGVGNFGQLGDGSGRDRSSPTTIVGLSDIVSIATGYAHSLAINEVGTVFGWGYNEDGILCKGDFDRIEDAPLETLLATPFETDGVYQIDGGSGHTIALLENRTVVTCGYNGYGQLGSDTLERISTPFPVPDL